MDEDFLNEIWAQFESEAVEHCKISEDLLLDSAASDLSKADIDSLFRSFHSLKGLTGSIGMSQTVSLTHLAEDLVSEIRKGQIKLSNKIRSALLRFVDFLKIVIKFSIKERKEVVPANISACKKELEEIHHSIISIKDIKNLEDDIEAPASDQSDETLASIEEERYTQVSSASLDELFKKSGTLISRANSLKRAFEQLGQMIENDYANSILDKLINDVQILNGKVTDLRLISVSGLVRRLKRASMDLSQTLGKDIKFDVQGDNERADRSIIRTLADPLLHMIRNAIDHGIENKSERQKKGIGKIRLSFEKEGDNLVITVADDGHGLDKSKILKKALEQNLISGLNPKEMRDQDIYSLIFKPGFSTLENITSTSGRGVGMDVVEKNIALLGGKIEVSSSKNTGTKFLISIPGAVSTEECIILKDLPTFYAIPSRSIQWIKNKSDLEMDIVAGVEHLRHNKSQIPIQNLKNLLSLPVNEGNDLIEKVILLSLSDKAIALNYSGNFKYAEFVFDQPDKLISNLPLVSGTTVDDDKNIIFRLHVESLFNYDDEAA